MENHLSSPDSITSTPTAPASDSKVTYTTAGTPYKPSTCQPLQPPARRGRSLKWSAGTHTSGLSLLPKSVLATLPLKIGNHTSSLPQYSPLQENYDRAPSPLNEGDHVCINMSAQVPGLGSSATPSPLNSLFSEAERDTFSDVDESEESSDDCEMGMELLLNMTVKSLHNLASYSNPNQKKAQKALRGIKPALNSLGVSRSDGPSTPLNRSTGHRDIFQINAASPVTFRPPQPEALAFGRFQDDAFWNPDENNSSTEGLKTFDPTVGGSTSRGPGKFPSATLSSGPGAPRPLTAGPPGQRQYRPSTFETTFKALQTNAPGQSISQDEDEDVLMITRQTLRQAGLDNVGTEPTSPLFKRPISLSPQPPSTSLAKNMTSSSDLLVGINAARDVDSSSAYPYSGGHQCQGSMATSSWTWPPPPAPACWASSWEHMQTRYTAGTRQFVARENATRNERNNRAWYAGADFLTATPEDVAFQCQQRPKAKPAFGVIGDGRPSKNRNQYRPMEINDANRMPVADHAAPLLKMAFASLREFLEDESQEKAAQASK